MTDYEKEYNEFMVKLADKMKDMRQDFNKLSPQNQKRIEKEISNIAIWEFLNRVKNNF